ncbi:YciI family protein [Paralcaligenes sp. KSB-10]|uniref:YciI family protein n=1 Tax=Paralcaligenes sp. KSB-10 TaxID=2901142 RepID=UPI001E57179F|nr:YciI family protein [Paralcaligenes sp. KSB-10]UHL64191.1 YciI family protein [Paralcaligenes sp. KSB-10]
MLFAVRFYDRPKRPEVRKSFLNAHLEWLRVHSDVILIGGSLRLDPESDAIGALWIVHCDSKSVIEDLLRTDPFWIHGLRERYEIHSWHKAFPEQTAI